MGGGDQETESPARDGRLRRRRRGICADATKSRRDTKTKTKGSLARSREVQPIPGVMERGTSLSPVDSATTIALRLPGWLASPTRRPRFGRAERHHHLDLLAIAATCVRCREHVRLRGRSSRPRARLAALGRRPTTPGGYGSSPRRSLSNTGARHARRLEQLRVKASFQKGGSR